MSAKYIVGIVAISVLVIGILVAQNMTSETPNIENSPTTVLPYGSRELAYGELAKFADISIRPLAIVEDSRCPVDVQCIQAGTVRVEVEVVSGAGTSTIIAKLDEAVTTNGENITLLGVAPDTHSKTSIATGDYRFTFSVASQIAPVLNTKCYVGGCSSQLCTDRPDMVSTCIYSPSYACYKGATCSRQASGKCGWTPTTALTACLSSNQVGI